MTGQLGRFGPAPALTRPGVRAAPAADPKRAPPGGTVRVITGAYHTAQPTGDGRLPYRLDRTALPPLPFHHTGPRSHV